MTYLFHSEAESEHLESIRHYESRRQGLGDRYLQEFEQLMAKVVERPHRFRIERQPDIRRASLVRFPYKVVYRVVESTVQVLAVSHKRRRPGYWVERV